MVRFNLILGLVSFMLLVCVCCKNNTIQSIEKSTADSIEVVTNIDTLTTDTLITKK